MVRTVADVGLPASTLPDSDPLWDEAERLLEEPMPTDTVVRMTPRAEGPMVPWLQARQSFVASISAELEVSEAMTAGQRAETQAAVALVREQLLLAGAAMTLTGMMQLSEEEMASELAESMTEELQRIAKHYGQCVTTEEVPLEWKLFCRERRAALAERFGASLVVEPAAMLELRRVARAHRLGPFPPGPARCFEPRSGEAGSNRLTDVLVAMMGSAMGSLGADTQPDGAYRGDLMLVAGPGHRSPLTERERAAVIRRVERRASSLIHGRATGTRETTRGAERWRASHPCRAAYSDLTAARQATPEESIGEVVLACSGPTECSVQLRVHSPFATISEDFVVPWTFSNEVVDPTDPASWVAAVDGLALRESPDMEFPDLEQMVRSEDDHRVALGGISEESLVPVVEALTACTVAVPRRLGALWVVDRRGRTRLELRGHAADLPCARRAIESASLPGGQPGRALLSVLLAPAPSPRERAFGFPAEGDTRVRINGIPRNLALEEAVARCQSAHGSTDAAVGVAFSVGLTEDGKALAREEALGDASTEYRACVRAAVDASVRGCSPLPFEGVVCSMPASLGADEGQTEPAPGPA